MTVIYVLLLVVFLVILAVKSLKIPKYKYMFRNTILSKSKKYELAPVLRGRVYYPRYFFIPSLKQYMVYSDVDETGDFRVSQMDSKRAGNVYSLLDEYGNNIIKFETSLSFSNRSGRFYGSSTYIPLLETGKTEELPYDEIHNSNLDLGARDFEKLFVQLYTSAKYIEFVNLRVMGDHIHDGGIVFKRQDKIEILLSGVRDSRMISQFHENLTTNDRGNHYVPNISKKETFPQSEPSIKMIWMKTTDTNPFMHWRTGLHREFQIKKRIGISSSMNGIPNYVRTEAWSTTYVRFNTKGETFRIKILNVEKFGPVYNLGLRTFQLPKNIRTKNSLVFMESVQNCGNNRLGGGVFVVRPTINTNPSADIPSDMTEKHFNTLPITLQEALMNPEEITSLKVYDKNVNGWIPELERLKNLTHLEMTASIIEIPDEISKLSKLQELTLENCNIQKISFHLNQLTELRELDFSSNKLTEFPTVFLELKNLKRLNIGANEISSLPDEINKLEQLEYLSLNRTAITELPESMIGMTKLYIDDSNNLKNKVANEYKHLFVHKEKN